MSQKNHHFAVCSLYLIHAISEEKLYLLLCVNDFPPYKQNDEEFLANYLQVYF